jgi:alkylhydroperoxidase/carboxymuconolactone decarboxylase family protein YurZ
MYLPEIYQQFSENYQEIFKDYKQLGITIRESGPLDSKLQDLVKLGIAIGANSQGAVMSSTRKALESGSSPEEVMHAVLLSITTTGFPNMIAALKWVEAVLAENPNEEE